ncbi:MAG: hypothetical protein A3H91_16860 [Gammaproteobacteria bacterium RIFCSPLOWO2_02_FULL_61_13]|nr:MAG: hypothetical protein A3H91_16860 [Gammaproteobacteria bacterium RIFCSPLOWO2_02_FULL_61_13]
MALLTVVILIGLVATVLSLGFGVASMARGGSYDEQHATQFMFARVASQAITVVMLLIALYVVNG